MPPAIRRVATMFGSLLGMSAVAIAQVPDVSAYLGQPTVEIRLQIEGRVVDDPALLELVETRTAEPLTMVAVRESVLHLFSLGRFEDVRVDAISTDAGVDLIYDLVPVHPVGDIVFQGALGMSSGRLRTAITDRYGRTPGPAQFPEMVQIVEELHRDRGYMNPVVSGRAEVDHAREQTVLVFDVQAGVRARIGEIEITTTPGESPVNLPQQLGIEAGRPYDRTQLDERVDDYVSGLRRRGYYLADVTHALRVTDQGRVVVVSVDHFMGPRVVVRFVGDPVPFGQEQALADIQSESSVDEDLLEDAARRIVIALNHWGYRRAQTDFERRRSDGLLEVIFDVDAGPLYRMARVDIVGNREISTADIVSEVELTQGAPFVQEQLDAAAETLVGYYRRRGFVEATVEASVLEIPSESADDDERQIEVAIEIDEGPRALITSVTFIGNGSVVDEELRARLQLQPGSPFFRPDIIVSRDLVLLHYLNLGYQTAAVDVRAEFTAGPEAAAIVFDIAEGQKILVEHVLIVGNKRISQDTIRRELLLTAGAPLALDDLIESQRRLRALGVFRSVQITEISGARSDTRDILVTVDEGPATSIGYGGGLEAGRRLVRTADGRSEERLEFAPRGFFEIGRRNLWGKNRSIDLFTRVSVRRGDDVQDTTPSSGGLSFNEYRLVGTYREPRPFGWNAEIVVSAFLEQAIRSSFNFNRRGVNAEIVRRLSSDVNVIGGYSFDRTKLFDERFNPEDELLIDRLFPRVRLSSVSGAAVRDTRGDPLDPQGGTLLSIDSQLAGRAIGSEVGFSRTLIQSFLYRSLPRAGGTVLAIGGRLGLAVGFPRSVPRVDLDGNPVLDESGQPIVDEIDALPASERFFAGGGSTVRGFALDRLGTPDTIDSDGFPKGGNALVILNVELRMPVWRDLGAVAFVDAGNVFARISDLDLGEIRGSVGFGLRYQSPVGPIRVDLGFKLDRRVFDNGQREPRTALHVSIGQAF